MFVQYFIFLYPRIWGESKGRVKKIVFLVRAGGSGGKQGNERIFFSIIPFPPKLEETMENERKCLNFNLLIRSEPTV